MSKAAEYITVLLMLILFEVFYLVGKAWIQSLIQKKAYAVPSMRLGTQDTLSYPPSGQDK